MLSFLLSSVNLLSGIITEFSSIDLKEWEHWNTLDSMLLLNGLSIDLVRAGLEWHACEIILESGLVLVRRHEDHFKFLTVLIDFLVKTGEDWGEASAWWAPVSREIDCDELNTF